MIDLIEQQQKESSKTYIDQQLATGKTIKQLKNKYKDIIFKQRIKLILNRYNVPAMFKLDAAEYKMDYLNSLNQ